MLSMPSGIATPNQKVKAIQRDGRSLNG